MWGWVGVRRGVGMGREAAPSFAPCVLGAWRGSRGGGRNGDGAERAFGAWLERAGARGHWEVGRGANGRGAFATKALRRDEVCIEVPDALVLTAEASVAGGALARAGIDEGADNRRTDAHALVLALMAERCAGEASRWAPYIAMLPACVDHMPHEWPAEDLRLLEGTSTMRGLRGAVAPGAGGQLPSRVGDGFDTFCVPFAAKHGASFGFPAERDELYDLFSWATGVVASYSFSLGDKHESMVPVWDMLNHVSGAANVRLNHDAARGVLQMLATREIAKGEELVNSFGELPNGELLRRYGFVEEPLPASGGGGRVSRHPHERALLRSKAVVKAAAQLASWQNKREGTRRRRLVVRRGLFRPYFEVRQAPGGAGGVEPEPALAAFLYLLLCSPTEFERIARGGAEGARGKTSEAGTWHAVAVALAGACAREVEALTDLDQGFDPINDRQRAASVVVRAERGCLLELAHACEAGEAAARLQARGWCARRARNFLSFRRWALVRNPGGEGMKLVHRTDAVRHLRAFLK